MTFDQSIIPYHGGKKNGVIYRQCRISRDGKQWTAWIPKSIAREGALIVVSEGPMADKMRAAVVESVGSVSITHADVTAMGDYFKTHREGSDI